MQISIHKISIYPKFLKIVLLFLFTGISTLASAVTEIPKLQNATIIPDFKIIKAGEERKFQLPALPGKPGMITVLRCRMSSFGSSGCNNCARIMCNDTPLGMITSGGRPRLLFRDLTFMLKEPAFSKRKFRIFKGSNISLPFAKDCDDADKKTQDNKGSWFVFDISDAANPVDVNTITFRNIRVDLGGNNTLTVKDISIGYLPRTMLPKTQNKTLNMGKSFKQIKVNGTKLELFRNGGFAVTFPGVKPYVVETSINMALGAKSTLCANDKTAVQPTSYQVVNSNTLSIISRWKNVQLKRTLTLAKDGRLDWFDKWTNLDKKNIQGVPLRYKTGLAATNTRNYLSGSAEILESGFSANPSVFYENMDDNTSGCGFSIEDNISQLVLDCVNNNGIVEIFSHVLALPPGKSLTFHYSVSGVAKGGYWKFINDMRKRWNVGLYGIERPCFFGATIPVIPKLNQDARIKKTLGDLGKITVAITPWFGQLGRSVMTQRNSKRPVTIQQFEQREIDKKLLADKVAQYKRLLPNAKIMVLHHPAMQATYMPEFNKNPLNVSAIRNIDGSPYFHEGYNSIILKDKLCKEGWSIIYYLPIPGSPWYERLLSDIEYAISIGADGLYFDEFNFMTPRNYRRYDYSAWDGFSADLDEQGKVKVLKSDNSVTTNLFKTTVAQRLNAAGKIFLCNGGEIGRGANYAPVNSFIEGTALINMPQAHLHNVPLVLGNYGNERTRPGVMIAVREALSLGCIYSPHIFTNTVLEGEDNFVCKLYPITVTEIGPGFVAGKERFCTSKSGTFTWAGVDNGVAELFIYNESGNRINKGSFADIINGKITLSVPKGGIVIAEKTAIQPKKDTFSYLAIGNSITIHAICDYWWTRSGMAASEPSKAYVNLVAKELKKKHKNVNFNAFNFFQWELLKHDRAELLPMLDKHLDPNLDLVTIQLGENVTDNSTFKADLAELFRYIKKKSPKAKIIVISDFWSKIRHPHKKAAAKECGAKFVDLSPIIGKKEYMCGINTIIKDNEGKTHKVTHPGVGRHPGDKAMAYIANAIISALEGDKK